MSTTTLRPLAASPRVGVAGRLRTRLRGSLDDPSWYRPLLIALLAVTAVAYLINLTSAGNANSFYAAAVQAGTKSWKAFFFGSLDASNFITVDKPPAALWVMELSGRIFGFSSASMLVPEVLEGVLSVALLAAAVKRWFGAGAGLLAGLALAVTPVAALMFRFNNPDALMVCLMVASAYCLVRAVEGSSTRWLVAVGVCLGFAFLAKMMEAFLVVPGFALVYSLAAPGTRLRRVGQLAAGGVALVAASGWWVAIVALWPASSRPMIDGSPSNSILNLIWDYNGLGRLTGNESGTSVSATSSGFGGGANFSGSSGIFRLFNDVMGGQASWMLPAALVILVAGLIWRGRSARTDRMRAGLLIWGTWLVVTGICFSFSQGVIHTYYTVALAPPIAALMGIGVATAWRLRESLIARGLLSAVVAITAGWAVVLLGRDSGWMSWLTPLVILCGVVGSIGVLFCTESAWTLSGVSAVLRRRAMVLVACFAAVACLAGPVAYTAQTISTAQTGSTPSAGPSTGSSFGGPGTGGAASLGRASFGGASGGLPGASAPGASRVSGFPGGAGGGPGGSGGPGGGDSTNSALTKLLKASSGYRWAAATSGSQTAASLELASGGSPVMAISGFSGLGGEITLAQFKQYVAAGDIHYYVAGGGGGAGGFSGPASGSAGGPGSSPTSAAVAHGFGAAGASGPGGRSSGSQAAILAWVKAHFKSKAVGGQTVYDLSQPLS